MLNWNYVDNDVDGFHLHQHTAVDDLTHEFRQKASVPGHLTKPPARSKQAVFLAEDSTAEEIVHWLMVKGFSHRYDSICYS